MKKQQPKVDYTLIFLIGLVIGAVFGPVVYRLSTEPAGQDDNCIASIIPKDEMELPFWERISIPECTPVQKD